MLNDDYLVRYHSAEALLRFGGDPAPNLPAMKDAFGVVVDGEPAQLAVLRDQLGGAARAKLG